MSRFLRRIERATVSRRLLIFSILIGLQLFGYAILWRWFPLAPFISAVPQYDINRFAPTLASGAGYGLLFSGLYLCYGLAIRLLRHNGSSSSPKTIAQVAGIALLFALPMLATYPVNATDVYRYLIRGRVTSIYAGNPFDEPPSAFAADPYLPLAGEWATETSPYGPVWELAAAGMTRILPDASQNNLLRLVIAFKAMALAAHLLITVVIWAIAKQQPPAVRRERAALWAWNPGLLLFFVIDGHNDALMLLWLLLSWWMIQRKRSTLALISGVIAVLIKPIALLTLPFLALAAWQLQPTWRHRLKLLVGSGVSSLLLIWLAFMPFGTPLSLVERLAREAGSIAGFSPPTLIILIRQRLGMPAALTTISNGTTALFVVCALILFLLVLVGKRAPLRGIADLFWAYLVSALSFRLWYSSWPTAWLIVDDRPGARFRLHAGLWLLWTTSLSVLIYGHLWREILGRDHLLSHLIGVPFTFALPFLLARLTNRHL